MSTLIGYARFSIQDQEIELELDALKRASCKKNEIFMDKVSGIKSERLGLEKCLITLQKGDTLIVWRLDRLGRTMPHLVTLVEELRQKGMGLNQYVMG